MCGEMSDKDDYSKQIKSAFDKVISKFIGFLKSTSISGDNIELKEALALKD
jgi:hypothetical protein